MSAVDVIRKLEATNSRLEKEQIILDAWMKGEREFFLGAQKAYDILLSFGVKKVALIDEPDDGDPGSFTYPDFKALADKLATRKLTGGAAKEAITDAALSCNTSMWNEFYRRILLKDLRCGVSESTINKILEKIAKSDATAKDYIVPVFGCQLAKDGAKEENAKKVKGKKYLDVKLDGVRLLTVCDKEMGTVVQYTRNGAQNDNFKDITAKVGNLLDKLPFSLVLDGEITGKSFQTLMKQINRKEKVDTAASKLALFDVVPLVEFHAGKSKQNQRDRHALLCSLQPLFQEFCGDSVYVIPKLLVDLDTKEGQAAYKEFNREAIEAGYEGIMVKDPEAFYQTKRTDAWLKVKPFIEVSLAIVGYEEGEKGKQNEGNLGALICEGEDDGKQIRVNVGNGFGKDTILREEFWNNKQKYLGFIVEVRADCFSLAEGETVYSLRFPRFKGLRGTKPGEKL